MSDLREVFAGCAVLFVIAGSLFGVVKLIQWAVREHEIRNRRRREALEALVSRFGGTVQPSYFAAGHRLTLMVDGIPGEVSFQAAGKNQPPWTRIQFNAPSRRRLRVTPQGFGGWLKQLFGSVDIVIGDETFDRTFHVESSDASWARDTLDGPLRSELVRQREFAYGSGGVSLDCGPSGVTVRVGAMLVDDIPRLENLISLAIQVLRRVSFAPETGVALEVVEIRSGSECPICGHPVTEGPRCPSCGTPHHSDCWTYSGGCAIFGCAGRKAAA